MASRPASVAGELSLEPLKAWIAEQEEHLRIHGWPAALTDDERRALAVLVPQPPTPAAAPADDGDLGDHDWVSLLMSAHVPPKYDEEQTARPYSHSPLWRFRCQIREAPDQWFPDIPKDGTTSEARSDTGLYVRKKDARQYAARSACKWLMANRYMPSDGKSVTFPFGGGMRPVSRASSVPMASPMAPPMAALMAPPVSQALPSKRLFSETSLRDASPGQQSHLGHPPPQSPSPSQSSQSSLPVYIQHQQQSQQPRVQPLQPTQPPPLPAALLPVQPNAEPMTTLSSLYTTSYPAVASSSSQDRVQSMASWRRPRSRDSSSSSGGDDNVRPAHKAGESAGVIPPPPTQGLRISSGPRVNSNGHTPVKAKSPTGGITANFEDITNWERLQILCRLLKAGNPKDDLKPGNEGAEGIFSGRITLVPNKAAKNAKAKDGKEAAPSIVLPPGVGEVQDVYTRRAAREKAAQSVLDYLQKSMAVPRTM